MEIYILRHGIAEDRGQGPDAERALTGEGRQKLRRVLARAAKAGVSPSLILSSPLKRAVETAEMAASSLGYRGKIVQSDILLPQTAPDAFWQEIRSLRRESALLAAGHEPMLSTSIAWLLGAPALKMDFKKGALARIDVDHFGSRPQGELKWLITPRLAASD